jgi:hypothetical protein
MLQISKSNQKTGDHLKVVSSDNLFMEFITEKLGGMRDSCAVGTEDIVSQDNYVHIDRSH